MQRTVAVDEVFLLLELLAADAVPALVHAFVDVAGVVEPLDQGGDALGMPRLGRPDEIVERDVEVLPGPAEFVLHPVAVGQRIEPLFHRALVHVLRMLVVPHQETGLEAAQPFVAGDDVGARPSRTPCRDAGGC